MSNPQGPASTIDDDGIDEKGFWNSGITLDDVPDASNWPKLVKKEVLLMKEEEANPTFPPRRLAKFLLKREASTIIPPEKKRQKDAIKRLVDRGVFFSKKLKVPNGDEILVIKHGKRVEVCAAKCPHQGGDLCNGEIQDIEDMAVTPPRKSSSKQEMTDVPLPSNCVEVGEVVVQDDSDDDQTILKKSKKFKMVGRTLCYQVSQASTKSHTPSKQHMRGATPGHSSSAKTSNPLLSPIDKSDLPVTSMKFADYTDVIDDSQTPTFVSDPDRHVNVPINNTGEVINGSSMQIQNLEWDKNAAEILNDMEKRIEEHTFKEDRKLLSAESIADFSKTFEKEAPLVGFNNKKNKVSNPLEGVSLEGVFSDDEEGEQIIMFDDDYPKKRQQPPLLFHTNIPLDGTTPSNNNETINKRNSCSTFSSTSFHDVADEVDDEADIDKFLTDESDEKFYDFPELWTERSKFLPEVLNKKLIIVCPRHSWQFDLKDGKYRGTISGDNNNLKKYNFEIRDDGKIWIQIKTPKAALLRKKRSKILQRYISAAPDTKQ